MAPANTTSPEEQLKYVVICLKHNYTPIKPDFQKVAEECGIVTKEAASKRLSRLMKAQGVELTGLGPGHGRKRKATEFENGTPDFPPGVIVQQLRVNPNTTVADWPSGVVKKEPIDSFVKSPTQAMDNVKSWFNPHGV